MVRLTQGTEKELNLKAVYCVRMGKSTGVFGEGLGKVARVVGSSNAREFHRHAHAESDVNLCFIPAGLILSRRLHTFGRFLSRRGRTG